MVARFGLSALALGLAASGGLPDKLDWEPRKWNGCKHVRSLHQKLPKGHAAKRKAKRKQQRAARRK